MAKWQPTNQPDRYNEARLACFNPVLEAVAALRLPPLRARKLNGILNALIMQIEDGGDNPEVNNLLLAALRVGVLHQVGQQQAQSVLRAIDAFGDSEAKRWQQAAAGTLAPIVLSPLEQLEELIMTGYNLGKATAACDQWQEAWEVAQSLLTPTMRSTKDFDRQYPRLRPPLSDWAMEFLFELHNAGLSQAVYHERRLRYVYEFLARFPDEDEGRYLEFRRAEGEALWALGQAAAAEAVFAALVEKLPHKGWGYIGWADHYFLMNDSPKDYARAEAILRQALAQPDLEEREYVLERLQTMYQEWEKPEAAMAVATELAALRGKSSPTTTTGAKPAPSWLRKAKGKQSKAKKG
jgi:hypothetical protein